MSLERITKIRLPFDKRSEDPKKNYGIHSTDAWFILKGPRGAVQFMINLPAYLPHVQRELEQSPHPLPQRLREIQGWDVGCHSLEPQFDGHAKSECDILGECYYDGSSMRAEQWGDIIFSVRGENPETILWKMLEDEYNARFGK